MTKQEIVAAVVLAGIAAAALLIPRAPAKFEPAKVSAVAEAPPPLLAVAGWANHYGIKVVPSDVRLDHWRWAPPTEGSPAVRYVVEFRYEVGSNWAPIAVVAEDTGSFGVRVAGVDAEGRMGPFTPWVNYSNEAQ